MLRKSPYLDENYGYITTMMDSINIQDDFFNKPFDNQPNENSNTNFFFMNSENKRTSFSMKNINQKKQVETENSVFDKTIQMLNQGSMMFNNTQHTQQYSGQNNFIETQNTQKIMRCFGCLKELYTGNAGNDIMQEHVPFTDCSYCHTYSCLDCSRRCDSCSRFFCKICVTVQYEEYVDKTVCQECAQNGAQF